MGWELENISAEEMQPGDWEERERQRWWGGGQASWWSSQVGARLE